ncbi:MAG: hypothetical protein CM1200mP11_1580 [Nitrosopumilaceae archaeon]|nr:MAG: hypothetical protein CM1200mP11_1580 [Nitrosopumilaceae archaeon]
MIIILELLPAGYIPDARVQVDNARAFSQGNRMTYDESVEIATVSKYLADTAHKFLLNMEEYVQMAFQ